MVVHHCIQRGPHYLSHHRLRRGGSFALFPASTFLPFFSHQETWSSNQIPLRTSGLAESHEGCYHADATATSTNSQLVLPARPLDREK